MTKAEIVNEVAKSTGIEKIAVQSVVEAFMESVKGSIIRAIIKTANVFRKRLLFIYIFLIQY